MFGRLQLIVVAVALAAPAVASAQQGYPFSSPYGRPALGPVAPGMNVPLDLPPEMRRRALDLARRQAAAKYEPVPDTFDPKATENLSDFANWAATVRTQREYAAGLLAALGAKEIEQQAAAGELAQLKDALTAQVVNRDGWLDKAIPAWNAKMKRDAEAKRIADSQPSISPAGPPRPPNAPRIYKSPEYMVAVDGLYGDELGSAITAGDFPLRPGMGLRSPIPAEVGGKLLGKSVAVLDIIQFGYSAGGWVGNEVIIKGQMYENYQKQKDYEDRYKQYEREKAEWDAGGRGRDAWESWQARLRQERRDRAARDMMIFSALFGRASTWHPPAPPKPAIDPRLLEMLKTPPPKREEVSARDMALRLNRISTISCHQPQREDNNFNLSLSGFNGGRNDASRLLEMFNSAPNGGSMGGAGVRRK